jgi:hypothetical protein
MKNTMQCRSVKAAHEIMYKKYRNDYTSIENRRGVFTFHRPPQAFGNGKKNQVATFDPSRKTLTFEGAL